VSTKTKRDQSLSLNYEKPKPKLAWPEATPEPKFNLSLNIIYFNLSLKMPQAAKLKLYKSIQITWKAMLQNPLQNDLNTFMGFDLCNV